MPGLRDRYLALFNTGDPGAAGHDPAATLFRSDLVTRRTPGQAVEIEADAYVSGAPGVSGNVANDPSDAGT